MMFWHRDQLADWEYDEVIEGKKDEVVEAVQESKPIIDFVILLTTQAGFFVLAAVLIEQISTAGISLSLVVGLSCVVLLLLMLLQKSQRAINGSVEIAILHLQKITKVPVYLPNTHIVIYAIWTSILFVIQVAGTSGLALAFKEFVELSLAG